MDQQQLETNKNEDAMRMAISTMKQRLGVIEQGGGKKSLEKVRQRGKLTARERIHYLIDRDTPFTEIGAFAAYDMYEEYGGCPAAGTVGAAHSERTTAVPAASATLVTTFIAVHRPLARDSSTACSPWSSTSCGSAG